MGLGWGILQRLSNSFGVVSLNTLIQIVLCFIIIICASGAVLSHAAIRAQALRRHHPKMWGRRRPGGCDGGHPGCPKNRGKSFWDQLRNFLGPFWGYFGLLLFLSFLTVFFAFLGLKWKKSFFFSPKWKKVLFFAQNRKKNIENFPKKIEKKSKVIHEKTPYRRGHPTAVS